MGFCTLYGYKNGNISTLIAPLDGDLNFCGINRVGIDTVDIKGKDMTKFPKLYFTEISLNLKTSFKRAVCVKECPQKSAGKLECFDLTSKTNCDILSSDQYYNSRDILGICFPQSKDDLPESLKENWASFKEAFKSNKAGSMVYDLYLSSRAIYISIGLSFVYSLLFIYLMSAYAETLAWVCIFLL